MNFYLAARQPENEEPSLQPRTEPEPATRNYLFFVLSVTAALVLLVWLLSVFGDKTPGATPPATAPAPAVVPESPPEDAAAPPAPTVNEDLSAAPTGIPAEVGMQPAEQSVDVREPNGQPTEDTRRPPLHVTLDFLSDCWIEASADGAEKLSELKVQGESLSLNAEEFVEFKIGDVGAVQVEVNGIPFEIENRSGTSVRNVRIDLETAAAVAVAGPKSIAPPGDGDDVSEERQRNESGERR